MKRFQPSTLRISIMLLVLLAVVPALGLMLYTAKEQQRIAVANAQQDAQQVAQLIAADQQQLIDNARDVLGALALLPAIRTLDKSACDALLSGLIKRYPNYTNFWADRPDGEAVCSSAPQSGPISDAANPWFQRAIASGQFSVGDFQIGRVSGRAVVSIGYPIVDDAGEVVAVVATALDLGRLELSLGRTHLPAGATLTVIDGNGVVLARYPNDGPAVGQPAPDAALTATVHALGAGVTASTGPDGVRRLYGFASLGENAPNVYLQIGTPEEAAFAEAEGLYRRALAGLILGAVVALAAAWFGGGVVIVRRLRWLVTITQRLRAGDLDARTGPPYAPDELGRLAGAFDEMAASLQERDQALRRSEQRYSILARNFPNGAVFLFDTDLRFTLVGGLGRRNGLSDEEMVGSPIRDVVASQTWVDIEPLARAVLAGEEGAVESTYQDQVRMIRAVPIKDEQGTVVAGLATMQDITDLRRTEEAASRLAAIVETSGDAILGRSLPEGIVTSWNAAAERLYGYSAAEMVGRSMTGFVPEDRPEEGQWLIERIARGESITGFETVRRRKDGTLIDVSLSMAPLRDRDGRITGMSVIARDITARTRAEAALRASEEQLARTIETMAEGILMVGRDRTFTLANAAAERILGLERSEIHGRPGQSPNWRRFTLDGDPLPLSDYPFPRVQQAMTPIYGIEFIVEDPNGCRTVVSANASPILDAEGAFDGVVTSITDITERHRLEQALRRSEARFRALVQNAGDLILVVDPDSTIRYVSPAVERILGYTPAELTDTLGINLLNGEEAVAARQTLTQSMNILGSGRPLQFRVRHRDGSWRDLELIGNNLMHEPAVAGFVLNAWDITARKEAETRLADALALLEADMTRAARVQADLLPQESPVLDGFELAGACLSAREVGGDFYDWHSPSPGLLTLTIADVMGKGMPAALLMATVRAAMRAVVRESAPCEAMRYVGRTLNDDLSASDRFVTLFLGQLDLAARHLAYVDAGHGFAFLRRSDGSVEQLGPRGLPLGIPVEEGYEEHSIGFAAGDALILYSDGLLDARPDIGLDHHALAAHLDGAASAAEMVGRLTALAACAAPLPDDLTVVVLRCTED